MSDTLGLLEEAMQLARDVGYVVREEPLGDAAGGVCSVGGRRQILLDAASPATERLDLLLGILADDAAAMASPMSRLLARHLARRGGLPGN